MCVIIVQIQRNFKIMNVLENLHFETLVIINNNILKLVNNDASNVFDYYKVIIYDINEIFHKETNHI